MSFDHDRFMDYFRSLNSAEPVPLVIDEDLEWFNANVEQNGMEVVLSIPGTAQDLAISALIKSLDPFPGQLRPGDRAGPIIDNSVYPSVQRGGLRIYRIMHQEEQPDSGTE